MCTILLSKKNDRFVQRNRSDMPRTCPRALKQRDALGKTLHFLACDSYWGIRELARTLPFPPATVHRPFVSLRKPRLIDHVPASELYQFGAGFSVGVTAPEGPLRRFFAMGFKYLAWKDGSTAA